MRRLTAETRLHPAELILPLFVREGATEAVPIASMPGVSQHSLASLKRITGAMALFVAEWCGVEPCAPA